MNRRYQVLSVPGFKPHPDIWSIGQCQEFLTENPINNPIKIPYLKECIKEQEDIVTDAIAARAAEKEALEKNWTGKYLFLQLIHCLVDHDDLKWMYLNRNNLDDSRLTLEIETLLRGSLMCTIYWLTNGTMSSSSQKQSGLTIFMLILKHLKFYTILWWLIWPRQLQPK